ncbi:hypothetical protein ACFWUW_30415 [Streptomyces sp. NPDC058655]|uniref:hypothetical protein n=1 Tax=Streptomyces sp. NPDC058655 TaxID=3346577 RepID=UPI00366921B1
MASGGARWNAEAQRWEWTQESPASPPPPPPLPPSLPPRWPPDGPFQDGPFQDGPVLDGAGGSGGPGPRPYRPWRTPLLVALGSALVGASAVAGWLALDKGDPKAPAPPPTASGATDAQPGPTGASASPSGSPGPSPSPTAAPATGTPDPAYTVLHNEKGFSVAVPAGWRASTDETGSGSFYRPPGDRTALLQVFRVTEPDSSGACELLRLSSRGLDDGNPGYRELSVDPLPAGGCELVYEYDSAEAGGRRRGIERIVVAPDGRRWALLAAGPAADPAAVRARLTAALDSFRTD